MSTKTVHIWWQNKKDECSVCTAFIYIHAWLHITFLESQTINCWYILATSTS